MALTNTDRFGLRKHDPGDIDWAGDANANMDDIDDVLGLVYCDAGDGSPGLLSQKIDGDTLQANFGSHRIEVSPAAVTKKLFAADQGGVNALSAAPLPAWTSHELGQCIMVGVIHTNTGAATLNVSGLGAKAIKRADGTELPANTLLAGGIYWMVYNGIHFQLLNGG